MTCNLCRMQQLQPGEMHLDLLKRVETAVEFGDVGTREEFLLTYDKVIVIIVISLFLRGSQKDITNKLKSYEIGHDDPRVWSGHCGIQVEKS